MCIAPTPNSGEMPLRAQSRKSIGSVIPDLSGVTLNCFQCENKLALDPFIFLSSTASQMYAGETLRH